MTIHWHFEKMSPQTVVTGESDQSAGSHMRDAIQTRNSNSPEPPEGMEPSNLPDLSPVFSSDGIALLKTSYVAQALKDVAALVFGLFFLCALAGSVPLAIALMLIANF
jgi:hypothetical protein